jgi:mono/diheme cytochrome c family protein
MTARSLTLMALLFIPAQVSATPALPEGPGRPLVAAACLQCHGPQPFAQLRMNQAGWRAEVENMALRGAQIGPDQIGQVSQYLATAYGPGVPDPAQPKLPITLATGQGALLVQASCAICHGLQRVTAAQRPGHQWSTIVHRMVQLGAPLNPTQTSEVIAYLQTAYAAGDKPAGSIPGRAGASLAPER